MNMRHYIRANFKDKRFRNILCILGIMVGLILFIVVNFFSLSYESLIIKAFSPIQNYNQIVQRGTSFSRMLPYYSYINESVYDEMELNPDFASADIYPTALKRITDYSEDKYLDKNIVFGIPNGKMGSFFSSLSIAEGTWVQNETQVVIGYDLNHQYGFTVGDLLVLEGKNYTISGVLEEETSLFDWFIFMDLHEFQIQYSMEDQLTSIFITYERSSESYFESEVESTYLDLEFLTIDEMNKITGNLLSRTEKTSIVFMLLTFFCSTLFTTSIVFLNVHDRKKEIATLRSIGAPQKDIFKLIYGEVFIIAIIALLAVPVGILLYTYLTFKTMNITGYLAMTLPQAFRLTIIKITWENSLLLISMHFGSSFIMAGIPYYLVMKNDIQSEIRGG
ncbi:MAG: ABC transporter permease [Candidatus Lokiarchaeota archaeon]|nr:ABC transporter permease [Candidatus Lokiarchaeota archaeon]